MGLSVCWDYLFLKSVRVESTVYACTGPQRYSIQEGISQCMSQRFDHVLARSMVRTSPWQSSTWWPEPPWSFTHKPLLVDMHQDRQNTTISSRVSWVMDQHPETWTLWSHLSSQCLEQSKHNTLFPQRKYRHRKHIFGIRDFTVTIRKYIYLLQ